MLPPLIHHLTSFSSTPRWDPQVWTTFLRDLRAKSRPPARRRFKHGFCYCEPLEMRVVLSADTGLLSQLAGSVLGDVSPVFNAVSTVTGTPLNSVISPMLQTATPSSQAGAGQPGNSSSGTILGLGSIVNQIVPVNSLLTLPVASTGSGGIPAGSNPTGGQLVPHIGSPLAMVPTAFFSAPTTGLGSGSMTPSSFPGSPIPSASGPFNSLQIADATPLSQSTGTTLQPVYSGLAVNLGAQTDSSNAPQLNDDAASENPQSLSQFFGGSGMTTNNAFADDAAADQELEAVALVTEGEIAKLERIDAAAKVATGQEATKRSTMSRGNTELPFDYGYGHERRVATTSAAKQQDRDGDSGNSHSWLLTALALLVAGAMGTAHRSSTDRVFSSHDFWNELAGQNPHQN